MAEESSTSGGEHRPSDLSVEPTESSRMWLPAALSLLGSTGALSVFGPLTGRSHWEGFLFALGLTPEEFPAEPSQVTVYAYNAILVGAIEMVRQMWSLWPLFALLLVAATVISATWTSPKVKSRARSLIEVFKKRSDGIGAGSLAFRAMTQLTVFILSLLVVGYFALVVALLAISPHQARQLGIREGERTRTAQALAIAGSPRCMSIAASGIAFSCPTVVAYGDNVLAVLDGSRIYRVVRNGASIASALPPAASPVPRDSSQ